MAFPPAPLWVMVLCGVAFSLFVIIAAHIMTDLVWRISRWLRSLGVRKWWWVLLIALAAPGCASKNYVDTRIEDVNDKLEATWDAAEHAVLTTKAGGGEDATAAVEGIKAGANRSRTPLPEREDWSDQLWLYLGGILTLAYRYLVGRWPVLTGILEIFLPGQKAKAKTTRRKTS